jgi:hypothetical protein
LRGTREKIGIVNGFGCFPDKVEPAKNTGTFIPDDFEHEIATNFLLKEKRLVVLTSCSHRGVINTIRQAQAASGISKVHAVIGGFHIVPPLDDNYIHQVIAALREIGPDYLVLAHCCGERFYDLARAVNDVLEPGGISLVQANGELAGQTVPHVHVHVLPRRTGDNLLLNWDRDRTDQNMADSARIAEIAARLCSRLRS